MSRETSKGPDRLYRKVAVVIPFYQKERGILQRALQSIFAQKLPPGVELDVIIADDASPLDPATDIEAAGVRPEGISVRVVRRPKNGGPGAARNTGFEAVAPDTSFIALLDSDDTWRPDHISRALTAMADDADVYFSNHLKDGAIHFDLRNSKFLRNCRFKAVRSTEIDGVEVLVYDGLLVADYMVEEFLAHLSTIVFSVPRLGGVRFEERLRVAGEDCVFLLDLALGAWRVCCSLSVDVDRGSGVSIHTGAFEWGSERDFYRRICNLAALKVMRRRIAWPGRKLKRISERVFIKRRVAGFLLTRALYQRMFPLGPLVNLAWRLDWPVAALAPAYAALFLLYRHQFGVAGIDLED